MKNCFFIGHRDTNTEIYPLLLRAVERHITEYGVTDFFIGHYGSFDRMAAKAVKEVKKRRPEMRLILVLPYHPAIRPIKTPEGFDGTYYPWTDERIPKRLAIVKTNQRMVDTCDYLIAYAWHFLGGSGQIVEYARKHEAKGLIRVTNLAAKPSSIYLVKKVAKTPIRHLLDFCHFGLFLCDRWSDGCRGRSKP